MTAAFASIFRELLRDIDRVEAQRQAEELGLPEGDLDAFLRVLGPTFDELKHLTGAFPDLTNPDQVPEEFIAHLAALVGYEPLSGKPPHFHRKRLRTAVEEYRRRGTKPSVLFDFRMHGLEGDIDETWRSTLRLNHQATLGRVKLAGRVHNAGVVRVHTASPLPTIRDVLRNTHPAGRRLFLSQRFADCFAPDLNDAWRVARTCRKTTIAFGSLAFKPGRHALNSPHGLSGTRHRWSAATARVTTQSNLTPTPTACQTVRHGVRANLTTLDGATIMSVVHFP